MCVQGTSRVYCKINLLLPNSASDIEYPYQDSVDSFALEECGPLHHGLGSLTLAATIVFGGSYMQLAYPVGVNMLPGRGKSGRAEIWNCTFWHNKSV